MCRSWRSSTELANVYVLRGWILRKLGTHQRNENSWFGFILSVHEHYCKTSLTFATLWTDNKLIFPKTGFGISHNLSPFERENFLFMGKFKKKYISKCLPLKFLSSMLTVKQYTFFSDLLRMSSVLPKDQKISTKLKGSYSRKALIFPMHWKEKLWETNSDKTK